jgi:nicotinamide N-methyltransferase
MEAATTEENSTEPEEDFVSLFTEPEGFRPPTPPPTKATYQLPVEPCQTIQLTLVGSHPLWAHHLWNASPTLSNYLCRDKSGLCRNKTVLELGAAAGLPSIVAHLLSASLVVTTDYPDAQLLDNLQLNVDDNIEEQNRHSVAVEGFIWGSDVAKLRAHLGSEKEYFDLLLLSDLIFNHQAHGAMLDTMDACLPPGSAIESHDRPDGPQALVFFTHHRPHLADKDLGFFREAKTRGWTCREVGTWKMPVSASSEDAPESHTYLWQALARQPMFPNDAGSEEVRATVHGWQVYR